MKTRFFTLACVASLLAVMAGCSKSSDYAGANGFVVATDYMKADGKTDVTDAIQNLIDSNPNRTIVFPDGTYLVSRSILTPADPNKSVALKLANYAVLKASGPWTEGGAVLRLGASHPANDINTNGSNYGLTGGIIDGSGVADGVSIDGGRETRIRDVSIKRTKVGVHIKHGANSGSSDADVIDVNIVGNDKANSIGVLVEGYDNTFTNMRIASVNTGVWVKSGGNSLRNIHPLYIFADGQDYGSSCGFRVEQDNNWFNFCYSDQFATAFKVAGEAKCNFTDCFAWWYYGKVDSQVAFHCDGKFDSFVTGFKLGFHGECPNVALIVAEKGGKGSFTNQVMPDRKLSPEDVSAYYVK